MWEQKNSSIRQKKGCKYITPDIAVEIHGRVHITKKRNLVLHTTAKSLIHKAEIMRQIRKYAKFNLSVYINFLITKQAFI